MARKFKEKMLELEPKSHDRNLLKKNKHLHIYAMISFWFRYC